MSKPTKAEVKKSAGKKSKKQAPLPTSATAAVATTPTAASSTRKRPGEAFDASAETSGYVSKKRKTSEGVQLSTIAYVVDIFVQRIDRRLFDADPNIKAKARSDHISWKRFGFYPQEVVDIFQKEKEAKEKMIQEQQSRKKEAKRQETGKFLLVVVSDDNSLMPKQHFKEKKFMILLQMTRLISWKRYQDRQCTVDRSPRTTCIKLRCMVTSKLMGPSPTFPDSDFFLNTFQQRADDFD